MPKQKTVSADEKHAANGVTMNQGKPEQEEGIVRSVRGSVVDVQFTNGLPAINTLLWAGENGVPIEVASHLDADRLRGIALKSTAGLSRGDSAWTEGKPLRVPVGKILLGRMFNLFGEPIDGLDAPDNVNLRSVHNKPIELDKRVTKEEIFLTGIKAVDSMIPIGRGQRKE